MLHHFYFIDNQSLVDNNDNQKYLKHKSRHLIQFIVLIHRCAIKTLREKVIIIQISIYFQIINLYSIIYILVCIYLQFLITRLVIHILISAIYGWIFYDVGFNASFIHDNLMLLFFSLLFIMYTASSSMIINCKL